MKVSWPDVSTVGVIRDKKDHDLPVNAWTDAKNVRFQDGKIIRMKGYSEALPGAPFVPYWNMHCFDTAKESHWIVAGLTKVYDYSAGNYQEITKSGAVYGASASDLWNGGVLGNIPVINNGVGKPQMWAPVSSAQLLVDLTNWPATHVAQVIRPFKVFLFALDITETGDRFRHRVRISHPAAPGAVPSSWDDTDPTKDVYVTDLTDFSAGPLVDAVPLRDIMVVYKETSAHGFQFVGGRAKWRNFSILEQNGLLSQDCCCPILENSQHFVASGPDVIVHNGQTPRSILHERHRQWLLKNLDPINYHMSFCVENKQEGEAWFCFPMVGSTTVNMALVWNYRNDTITFRPLDGYSHIAPGIIPQADDETWESDETSWDSDVTLWDSSTHPAFMRRMLSVKPADSKLFHLDFSEQADGTDFEAYVERTGLAVIMEQSGEIVLNKTMERMISRVYIDAEGDPFEVWIATTEAINGPYTWQLQGIFTPGVDEWIDVGLSTRMWGIRFRSVGGGNWAINGFQPDIVPTGNY